MNKTLLKEQIVDIINNEKNLCGYKGVRRSVLHHVLNYVNKQAVKGSTLDNLFVELMNEGRIEPYKVASKGKATFYTTV